MREAWIYGCGSLRTEASNLLAELGFSPRQVPSDGALRPDAGASQAPQPDLLLLVVCDGDRASQAGLLQWRLRADPDLRDVPLVVAADAARAVASIAARDADEIIVRPLRIEELGVRIARARRRHGIVTGVVLRLGSLDIDLAAYEVRLDGEALELTALEYRLLELLATHPRRVHSRESLISRMWQHDAGASERAVDGHVGRLRAKLGPEYGQRIRTVRNVGYRFE